jgi:protein O-GlcNAc transferase
MPVPPALGGPQPPLPPDISRPLRVGFLSTNLCAHPEGRFLRPVLAGLDRTQFETFCYSSTARPDALTEALRGLCDTWRDIRPLNDAGAAAAIRADGIDVLVDLTGHFGANRMGTLARAPAPVQVCHFGYPGTSGVPAVGWRLTDRWADPPGPGDPPDGFGPYAPPDQRPGNYTTERLFGLGELAWCYDPPAEACGVGPLPALERGHVTFVCVNNPLKVAPEAVAVWAQILRGVPGAVLEILADGRKRRPARRGPESGSGVEREPAAAYLLGLFERHGVGPDRVRLVPRRPRADYFEWIQTGDVALDPFPYNGGVTTCDTLWMGLPVIALRGDAYWSRQGAALLGNLGLGELVADTPAGYAEVAIALARDVDRLAELRRGLRERVRRSPIAGAASFARRLGEAYWGMWRAV